MIEQYGYMLAIHCFFTIMPVLQLIKNMDRQSTILVMDGTTQFIATLILWLARGKLKNKFGTGIIVFYIISTTMRIISTKLQIIEEDKTIEEMIILNRNIEILREKAIFFSIFFCPSLIHFFALILCYAAGIVSLTMIFPESEQEAKLKF